MNLEHAQEDLLTTLEGWRDAAIQMAPHLVVAFLVAIASLAASRFVRTGVRAALERAGTRSTIRDLVAKLAQAMVLLVGLMICLAVLDLDKAVTSLLAGAGVVGIALGFAFQDLATNLVSGVGLSLRHPFKQGDVITTNGIQGVVEQVELRTTTLRTFDGQLVRIPNKKVYQETLFNRSTSGRHRVEVECGVHYDSDLDQVVEVATEALDAVDGRCEALPVEIFFTSFGSSAIDFVAHVWIDFERQSNVLAARDQAVRRLKRAFDTHGIEIPFPIRTLRLGSDEARALRAMGRSPGSTGRHETHDDVEEAA